MTVRYALSKSEMLTALWYSAKYSGRLRRRLLVLPAFVAVASLLGAYVGRHEVTTADLVIAAAWAVGALLLMPLLVAARTKTQERVLELTPEGITTRVGALSGTVPWRAVAFVHDVGRFVVIAGTNMNAFLIPNRAFADDQERTRFMSEARTFAENP
jgi:hypothetical protein